MDQERDCMRHVWNGDYMYSMMRKLFKCHLKSAGKIFCWLLFYCLSEMWVIAYCLLRLCSSMKIWFWWTTLYFQNMFQIRHLPSSLSHSLTLVTSFQLKIKEAMHILWERPSLNSQVKHLNLSLSYQLVYFLSFNNFTLLHLYP